MFKSCIATRDGADGTTMQSECILKVFCSLKKKGNLHRRVNLLTEGIEVRKREQGRVDDRIVQSA